MIIVKTPKTKVSKSKIRKYSLRNEFKCDELKLISNCGSIVCAATKEEKIKAINGKIEDINKRIIQIKLSLQKGFVHIIIGNCYEGDIQMSGGLPKTTKKNKEYHGFGVKGIRQTVKKYDGSTTIKAENGWFELRILIPLK